MNNDFEQDFLNSIRQTPAPTPQNIPTPPTPKENPSLKNEKPASKKSFFIPFIISLIIIVVKTLALIILIINVSQPQEPTYVLYYEDENEEDDEVNIPDTDDANYIFDSEGNLIAFDIICKLDDNSFSFSSDNTYIKDNNISGTYSIYNSSVISVTDSEDNSHTLYYDGFSIIDETDIYDCGINDN